MRRLHKIDANRSVYSATGTAEYDAGWQEPAPERIAMYEGDIGNLFEVYVDISCPAEQGWEVVSAGKTYTIRDIKVMDFAPGSVNYKRIIVSEKD